MTEAHLDACSLIYLTEGAAGCRSAVKARLRTLPATAGLMTSRISRLECRSKPTRDRDAALLARYDAAFARTRVVDVTGEQQAVLDVVASRTEVPLDVRGIEHGLGVLAGDGAGAPVGVQQPGAEGALALAQGDVPRLDLPLVVHERLEGRLVEVGEQLVGSLHLGEQADGARRVHLGLPLHDVPRPPRGLSPRDPPFLGPELDRPEDRPADGRAFGLPREKVDAAVLTDAVEESAAVRIAILPIEALPRDLEITRAELGEEAVTGVRVHGIVRCGLNLTL